MGTNKIRTCRPRSDMAKTKPDIFRLGRVGYLIYPDLILVYEGFILYFFDLLVFIRILDPTRISLWDSGNVDAMSARGFMQVPLMHLFWIYTLCLTSWNLSITFLTFHLPVVTLTNEFSPMRYNLPPHLPIVEAIYTLYILSNFRTISIVILVLPNL